jgi:23S rRNA (cytidine1920-2'-O)/16S rRNA (cytidine1409-2'-O)-methyltransferase
VRLDAYLVAQGLARSRDTAKRAIAAGAVQVDGVSARKPSDKVPAGADVVYAGVEDAYVSRGALKLRHGLTRFDIDPEGATSLDLGASTGGFTQVLLEAGASRVYAVDVGRGQLAGPIASDPRVVNLEATHAKDLNRDNVADPIDLLVCDVSFISLTKALPAPSGLCRPGARICALLKPQFELGPDAIGKGGLVRLSTEESRDVLQHEVMPRIAGLGWVLSDMVESPIKGGEGNTEFLVAGTYAP